MAADLSAKASLYTEGFSEGVQKIREKLNQLNTELVHNAQEIKKTNSEIKSLTDEQKKLAAEMKDGGTDDQKKKMQELSDKVAQANVKLGQLKTIQQELKGSLRETSKELANTGKEAGGAGKEMENAFAAAGEALKAAGITAALKEIYQAFADCVSVAMEFQANMSTVEALSGANSQELEALTAQAKELGATTKYTAAQAAEAMTYMGMAGWNAQEMAGGMDGVLSLAAASGEDLALVADIVTDNLTAFGLTAADTARFADVLAAAATNSNTSVSIMGETFKQSASVAGALGYSIEDVATAVGLMANAGVKGSMAGTALKNTFNGLLEGATLTSEAFGTVEISAVKADGTMKSFGETINELRGYFSQMTEAESVTNAMDISGARGYNGLLAILNATDEAYDSLRGKIEDCSGAAEKMAETKMDNLAGQAALMDSAFEALKTTIGESFEPELREAAKAITDTVTGINDFTVNNEGLVKSVIAAGAAFGVLVGVPAVINAIKTAMAALNITMSVSPITFVTSAIFGLVTGLGNLYSSLKTTTEIIDEASGAAKKLSDEADKAAEKTDRLSDIAEKYKDINDNMEESAEKTAALEELQRTLDQAYGNTAAGIDLVNGKYDEQKEKLGGLITEMDRYARAKALEAYDEMQTANEVESNHIVDRDAGRRELWDNKLLQQTVYKATQRGLSGFNMTYGDNEVFEIVGTFEEKFEAYKAIVEELEKAGLDVNEETRGYYIEMVEKTQEYGEKVEQNRVIQEKYSLAIGESNNMLEKECDAAEKASAQIYEQGQKTKRSADEIKKGLDDCKKSTSALVKEAKTLSSAFAEQNENGALSAETILSLVDAGYAAAIAVDAETGAVRLDAQAYRELAEAKLEASKADILAEKNKVEADNAGMRRDIATAWASGDHKRAAALTAEYNALFADYDAQLAALNSIDLSKVTSGTYGTTAKKNDPKTTDDKTAYDEKTPLDLFREEKDKLDYERDMDQITTEKYYAGLTELRKRYIDALGEDSAEIRSIDKSIHAYEKTNEQTNEQTDEDKYRAERDELDYKFKMGKVSEEKYYEEIGRLRDDYLEKNSSLWRSANIEIYNYQKKLADEAAKNAEKLAEETAEKIKNSYAEANKAFQEAADERIRIIDDELDAKRKARDEAIAAIDAEIEARKRLNEDSDIQKEIDAVTAQLNYAQLDDFSRAQLERKLKNLYDEQADIQWQRNAADSKAAINSKYDEDAEAAEIAKEKITEAADYVESALDRAADGISSCSEAITRAAGALGGIFSSFGAFAAASSPVINNYSSAGKRTYNTSVSFSQQPFTLSQIAFAVLDAIKGSPIL